MNIRYIVSILIVAVSILGYASIPDTVQWSRIPLADKSGTFFLDINSKGRTTVKDIDFGTAAILMVYPGPKRISYKGRSYDTLSVVRHIFVDCNSNLIAVSMEFHFDVPFPTSTDSPVASFKYNSNSDLFHPINKTSVIYKTMCPFTL